MTSDERECPFCAETIKAKAILCRHCGSSVEIIEPSTLEPESEVPKSCWRCGQSKNDGEQCNACGAYFDGELRTEPAPEVPAEEPEMKLLPPPNMNREQNRSRGYVTTTRPQRSLGLVGGYWVVTLVLAAVSLAFQQWWAPIAVLVVSAGVFFTVFISCPGCGTWATKFSIRFHKEFLGSKEGWHTETQQAETKTNHITNDRYIVGTSESVTTSRVAVPHRDDFFLNYYRCGSCAREWTVQTSRRTNL